MFNQELAARHFTCSAIHIVEQLPSRAADRSMTAMASAMRRCSKPSSRYFRANEISVCDPAATCSAASIRRIFQGQVFGRPAFPDIRLMTVTTATLLDERRACPASATQPGSSTR